MNNEKKHSVIIKYNLTEEEIIRHSEDIDWDNFIRLHDPNGFSDEFWKQMHHHVVNVDNFFHYRQVEGQAGVSLVPIRESILYIISYRFSGLSEHLWMTISSRFKFNLEFAKTYKNKIAFYFLGKNNLISKDVKEFFKEEIEKEEHKRDINDLDINDLALI